MSPAFLGPPGFPYSHGPLPPENNDNDNDDLVLGVRIYTQGGAVVSVTGQVVGEPTDDKDKDDNADAKARPEEAKKEKEEKNEADLDKKEE
jgi:hypothetical protein